MTRPLIVACAAALVVITSAAAQHTLGQNRFLSVARSIALFRKAGKVFQSPRCLNCHPAGDRPTQTDRMSRTSPGWCAASTETARQGLRAALVTTRRISTPRASQEIQGGASLPLRWGGRDGPWARSASKSRIRCETVARTRLRCSSMCRKTVWLDGHGRQVLTPSCPRHPGRVWRTHASLGRQRSALPAG